jgi:hypothetical protein
VNEPPNMPVPPKQGNLDIRYLRFKTAGQVFRNGVPAIAGGPSGTAGRGGAVVAEDGRYAPHGRAGHGAFVAEDGGLVPQSRAGRGAVVAAGGRGAYAARPECDL